MSIVSEISRLQGVRSNISNAINAKGVEVPSNATFGSFPALIGNIPQTSGGLPDSYMEYLNRDGSGMPTNIHAVNMPVYPGGVLGWNGVTDANIVGICGDNAANMLVNAPNIVNLRMEGFSFNNARYLAYNCANLKTLILNGNIPTNMSIVYSCANLSDLDITTGGTELSASGVLYSPIRYCNALLNFSLRGPNITNISYFFDNCVNVANVILNTPNLLNMAYAFRNTKLASMPNLPNSVQNATYAFYNTNVPNIPSLPSALSNMQFMFAYCNSIYTVGNIPEGALDLYHAFAYCSNINTIGDIPESVQNTGYLFRNCSNLVTVGNILTPNITSSAFSNTPNITTIGGLGPNITSLYGVFAGLTKLANIPTIPANVVNMALAFNACTALAGNIWIDSRVVANAYRCFYSTTSAKNVYLWQNYANGVQSATWNAFNAQYNAGANGVTLIARETL